MKGALGRLVLLAFVSALLVSACSPDQPAAVAAHPSAPATVGSAEHDGLPAGWHWESYRDVELGVPDGWGHGMSFGCSRRTDQPYVYRPGPEKTYISSCPAMPYPLPTPDPALRTSTGGTFVSFYASAPKEVAAEGAGAQRTEGDRTTVVDQDVTLVVQAEKSLRARILGTLRPITAGGADARGCPVRHPAAASQTWRPAPATPVTDRSDVSTLEVCRYDKGRLFASITLTGDPARTALAATRSTPPGSGPNDATCRSDFTAGDVTVLRASQGAGQGAGPPAETLIRYAGCTGHGFDDGTTIHQLTRASVNPFLTGATEMDGISGELKRILWP